MILSKLVPILIWVVPVGLSAQEGIVPCIGTDCDFCSLIQLADNIIDYLIGLLAVLAAIMFAWAGFLMITAAGDTGKISRAKEIFTNVMIGVIITLAAWLIVDTVMKLLVNEEFGFWNKITC